MPTASVLAAAKTPAEARAFLTETHDLLVAQVAGLDEAALPLPFRALGPNEPACGDVMKLQIKVNPQTGVIEDARFKTYGCGSAIASSSLVTEWVKGKTLDEAAALKNSQIAEELALPPVKIHCSILAEDAIKAAVDDYKAKHLGN